MIQPQSKGLENLSFYSTSTYQVIKEIARGGMGIIFLAEKNTGGVIDSIVLKSLRVISPEEEEKLHQEANIATMLRHENIVKTYGLESINMSKLPEDFCQLIRQDSSNIATESKTSLFSRLTGRRKKIENKGFLMLVMDYVKGTDFYTLFMRHLQKNLLLPVPLAAFIISRIACALSYAHTYIVHRDISPENILISEQGVCKLTDFGIAVIAHQEPDYWAGKLMYMAPEQIRNEKIDERADIFALGVVAYQAITGIPLLHVLPNMTFENQVGTICNQIENSIVLPHLVRKDVPVELSRIIGKMLSPVPEYRYQRASSVVNDLEKEFLYAKGFGPTNNSLASYIDIFNSDFQEYNEDELQQLSFLKDEDGQINLQRRLDVEGYTKIGQRMLAERKGSAVVNQLRQVYRENKKKKAKTAVPQKQAIIKVKYLDNVIEGFHLEGSRKITIGRRSRNDVVLPDRIVSGEHARFLLKESIPTIEDLQSNNGTFVNGKKIAHRQLIEGDRIQVGNTLLYFLWEKPKVFVGTTYYLEQENDLSCIPSSCSLEFLPSEENLSRLNDFTEAFLQHTFLGMMKRNVVIPALQEAARLFSKDNVDKPIQIKMVSAKKYVSFRCHATDSGYKYFISSISRRMSSGIDLRSSLEPEELAVSLILKVFERIELMRYSHELELKNFF